MAGIVFVLHRLTRQDNLVGVAVGYVYAALVSSGPFLVTVLAMAAIGILSEAAGGRQAVATFRLVTIYNFALRSEERRVGKTWCRTGSIRWCRELYTKQTKKSAHIKQKY